MRCRGLIALLIWGQSVAAADLGTWGDLWPVKEPDMLTVIMQRLTALEQSGEMGRKMDAFKERVIRNSLRPPAVPGIGRTEKYGSRLFDPSVRLAADIRDNEGRVPEIKTAKDFLQKMASDINSMNLSSCQVAQGLVGGLFPQTQESQQKVCQDIGSESNIFADWAASRQGCTVGGQSSSVRDKASDKDKERVLKNQNIIWEALKKNRMFDGNKELKEFIMTLTGTLIFGEDSEITPLPARTTDRDILRAIMEGGTAKIYHCNDSDKCLKVVADANVTIARDKALKSQITKLLTSIQNKAVSDTPLDAREQGFISSTTIPVFKYLIDPQMLGVSNSVVYQLTDYIGYDIMLQYIQELLQQARAMIATGNYPQAVMDNVLENLNQAQQQIAIFQSQVQVQQDALLVVERQMSYMRQQLSARMLSRYQNNYHFGGNSL